MCLSLGLLCLLVGGALALVNDLTAEPIAEATLRARQQAISELLPPFDSEVNETEIDGLQVFSATNGGVPVGEVVQTYSDDGFSGRITLLVGFDADGAVTGFRVLSHAETPGLGAKMDPWFATAPHDITGTTAPLNVKADGGDIDAISGATITSRAFLGAVNRARSVISKK